MHSACISFRDETSYANGGYQGLLFCRDVAKRMARVNVV